MEPRKFINSTLRGIRRARSELGHEDRGGGLEIGDVQPQHGGKRTKDAHFFPPLFVCQIPDVIVDLHKTFRFNIDCLAGSRLINDHAFNTALEFRFNRDGNSAVAKYRCSSFGREPLPYGLAEKLFNKFSCFTFPPLTV